MKIETEEIKLSLFTDYIIIYAENPKNLSKLSEYRKVTGYNGNIQKSISSLHTNNKEFEFFIF